LKYSYSSLLYYDTVWLGRQYVRHVFKLVVLGTGYGVRDEVASCTYILCDIEISFNPHLHVWYLYTLKMEAVCSSETLVGTYQTTCCCNTRNHNMNLHHHKNLKYYKRKVLPVHSMKAHRGSRGTAPLILNLSTRC